MELSKYQEITEKISREVEIYEKLGLNNNIYSLFLANGDNINIKVSPSNVAHLLGVNIDYLRQANRFKDTNCFNCLKSFLDDRYQYQNLVKEGKLQFDDMFSKHVDEKISAFIKNIKIRTDDMLYVIKYDKEKTYQIEELSDICDYYLVRLNLNTYYILGLKLNTNYYAPVTSRKYDNFSDYDRFISRIAKKQDITYPYLLKINNASTDFSSTLTTSVESKKSFADRTLNASKRYGATSAVGQDMIFQLNIALSERNRKSNNNSVINLLTDTIRSGNILDDDSIRGICGDVEISEDLRNLIDSCNDMMVNNGSSFKIETSYSDISSERDRLKKELEELKQEYLETQKQNEELKNQNQQLIIDNNNYVEQFEIIESAVQKIKK